MVTGQPAASLSRSSTGSSVDTKDQAPPRLGEGNPFPVPSPIPLTPGARARSQTSADTSFAPVSHEVEPRGDGAATPQEILAALSFGLDLVQHGAMLVAEEGIPRIANRAALAILQKKDGLSLARAGLAADRATDTRLLRKLLHDAIGTPELGEPKDSPLILPRRMAPHALIVRVIPGPELSCWPGTETRTALLKLYDQDIGLEIDAGKICQLFGLTRGEAALVIHLVRGKSIEGAAEELFISYHTARTHLKRIFMKTDTHRQTELVVRVLTVAM